MIPLLLYLLLHLFQTRHAVWHLKCHVQYHQLHMHNKRLVHYAYSNTCMSYSFCLQLCLPTGISSKHNTPDVYHTC